ncbi:metallophosphoesterase family protein [Proteiniclasticum sp.]|uniref:metallophosphoesterase family protein n=1 Tax=Proteiniclasticum sp. TaxID=2053595 RepID=UPI0028A2C274|nr:metallophosphoesterase family protein [Proteiniclasticum sp.]
MKYLILSDIHSNIQALNKVVDNEKYDRIIFLGDIIGYGADPFLCYKKFLELGGESAMGNHEYGVLNPLSLMNFSENARLGVLHTIKNLPEEYVNHMRNLPEYIQLDDCIFCHSMLDQPLDFSYVFPEDKDSIFLLASYRRMSELGAKIMFTGHTHKPCIFKMTGNEGVEIYPSKDGDIYLDDKLYIINVGSVGQSRNSIPKAHYAVYDTDERKVSFKSVDYNIREAAGRIEEEGLPELLAKRLYLGI